MLAPAVRKDFELPASHPCFGCAVRCSAVCGVLDADKLAQLRRLGSHSRLASGQPLFHEGDQADRVYTVTGGTLKLYTLLPDGRRQVTGFAHPGDFVGISVDGEYAFTAEAVEPTQLCAFFGVRFDEFVEENPKMERELYRLAAHEAAAAQQQFVLLGRKAAAERLASFFLSLLERTERVSGERETSFDLPMTRIDIADYLGLTKETVSRMLAHLRRRGLIRLKSQNCVEVLDREGLRAMAQGETADLLN